MILMAMTEGFKKIKMLLDFLLISNHDIKKSKYSSFLFNHYIIVIYTSQF